MGHYVPGEGWVLDPGEVPGSPTSYTDPTATPAPAPTAPATTEPPTVSPAPGTGMGNGSLPPGTSEVITNAANPATTNDPVAPGTYTPPAEPPAVVEPAPPPAVTPTPVTTPAPAPAAPAATPPSGTPPTGTIPGLTIPGLGADPVSEADKYKRDWWNVVKAGDYATLDLTDTQAFTAAQKLYTDSIAQSMKANADALAGYTGAAMRSATQQGMENVYGSENTYGAQGAGTSGAAQAAAARGMAIPIAQAQQQIAGMSAEQAAALNAQRFGMAQDLAGTYTGVVAPQYASSMSPGEIDLMKQLTKSGS